MNLLFWGCRFLTQPERWMMCLLIHQNEFAQSPRSCQTTGRARVQVLLERRDGDVCGADIQQPGAEPGHVRGNVKMRPALSA